MTNKFNFDDAVKALQSGKNLNGKDGVHTSLIKQSWSNTELMSNSLIVNMAVALKPLNLQSAVLSSTHQEIEVVALSLNSLKRTKQPSLTR